MKWRFRAEPVQQVLVVEQMTTGRQLPKLLILGEAFHTNYTIVGLILINFAILLPKSHKWNHLPILLYRTFLSQLLLCGCETGCHWLISIVLVHDLSVVSAILD
jgi:hypothetical protein